MEIFLLFQGNDKARLGERSTAEPSTRDRCGCQIKICEDRKRASPGHLR